MPKVKISEFDTVAANNTDIDGINLAEGMLPSDVNNAIRELMSQLKDFQTGAGGDSFNGPIGSTTAVSGAFTTVSATGDVSIADKIIHTGDTNTAIRFPSADTVTVETDGTERLRVTSTGAVQLSNNLTFTGTGNRITGDFSNATLANAVIFQTSTTNGGTTLSAIPNGTSSTSQFRFNNSSSDLVNHAYGLFRIDASAVSIYSAIAGTGTYLPLTMYTGGSERLRIDTSGNVGIGTSSPAYRLDVQSAAGQIGITSTTGTNFARLLLSNTGGSFQFGIDSSTGSNFGLGAYSRVIWNDGAYPLVLTTNSLERMRIDSSGNVGIGTASPTQALTVNGAVGYNAPVTVTDSTHTVATTTNWIIANRAGTVTLTLPAAASFTGRILTVKNVQAQTVVSASSNVVPIGSTTAGTAILTNTAGKFATLVSDGTNWIIMQAN